MHFEKIMNTLYSFAAAVVIFGAWAKLEHKDYGSVALTVGLLTETGIFFLYGLLEWGNHRPQPDHSVLPPSEQPSGTPSSAAEQTAELTTTLKKTNHILNKVFRTE
ncbi:MAG: hypothetical protein J0H74_35755 [Chitinophagaceae bacterium]|nr:hypothetical protein [Chitinophagaceae bacterium]